MATDFDGQSPGTLTIDQDTTVPACEACGHDLSVHDATSTRFCQASLTRTVARGCMCTSPDGTRLAPTSRSGAPMYGRGRFSPS
jgi:hypothetical protein